MSKLDIIGFAITGQIGAGKTTVAKNVLEMFPGQSAIVSFAAPLKELAVKMFGRPIDKATDRRFLQALGMGMRSDVLRDLGFDALSDYLIKHLPTYGAMDKYGSEKDPMRMARFKGILADYCLDPANRSDWGTPYHWVEKFAQKVHGLHSDGIKVFVTDDMRFLNEYRSACEFMGFASVRLEVTPEERERRLMNRDGKFDPGMDQDVSESEFKFIPYDVKFDTGAPDAKDSLESYFGGYKAKVALAA